MFEEIETKSTTEDETPVAETPTTTSEVTPEAELDAALAAQGEVEIEEVAEETSVEEPSLQDLIFEISNLKGRVSDLEGRLADHNTRSGHKI